MTASDIRHDDVHDLAASRFARPDFSAATGPARLARQRPESGGDFPPTQPNTRTFRFATSSSGGGRRGMAGFRAAGVLLCRLDEIASLLEGEKFILMRCINVRSHII